MSEPTELVWLSAQVPKPLRDALQERALKSERSASAELRLALRAYLDLEPPKSKGAAA